MKQLIAALLISTATYAGTIKHTDCRVVVEA